MPSYSKRLLTLEALIQQMREIINRESDDQSIENGDKFESSFTSSLGTNGSRNITFTTGAEPVFLALSIISASLSQVTIEVFKNPDVSSGSALTAFNLNDLAPKVTNVSILDNVTVNNSGERFGAANRFFNNNRPAMVKRKLAPNTTYLIRVSNGVLSSGSVSGYLTWVE